MPAAALRWGILGAGYIADRFAGQVAAHGGARLRRIGSRDAARAADFAARHRVEESGGYEAVLADPQIDAVYIALHNREHAVWSIAASRAGKPVLCEKPAGLDAREAEAMIAAADAAGTLWVEAFAYRFHPRWSAIRAAVAALSGPAVAEAAFCFHGGDPPKPRLVDPVGGGALLDVGCYPLSWLIGLFGEPESVACSGRLAATGVDLAAAATLRFAGGHVATATCAVDAALPQRAAVARGAAALEVDWPFRNPRDATARLTTADGAQAPLAWTEDGLELYAREAVAVAEAIGAREHPAMPWRDSLALARTIDRCRAALSP
jgi:predicted dehydrogenase